VPSPPPSEAGDTVDDFHGTPVSDPYRWLEAGDDPAVSAWVDAQNAHTDTVLAGAERWDQFAARALDLLQLPLTGGPAVAGESVFSIDRPAGRNQSVLVRRATRTPGPARLVVDPVALTGDETGALDWFEPSADGGLVAIGLSTGGDERSTLHVIDAEDGTTVGQPIPDARAASVAWLPDASGFLYTRYPTPGSVPEGRELYGRHVRQHVLGSDPADDPVVFDPASHRDDDTAWPEVSLSNDGRWAVIHVAVGWSRTDVHLLDRDNGHWTAVIEGTDVRSGFDVVGDRLVGVTTLAADRGRVVSVPLGATDPESWTTLIPERPDGVIESAVPVTDGLLVWSTVDAVAQLDHHGRDGTHRSAVALPEMGAISGVDADPVGDEAFLTITSFARPSSLFRWTPSGLTSWSEPVNGLDPADYAVDQVTITSPDGTSVPMFLVHRAGQTPSESTRCVLTGYGGFAVTNSPAFSPFVVSWCDDGGLVAVANIRGGAERGEGWHAAGRRENKTNVFDDFEAAADWLVDNGRTSRDRLAIRGGSNGGLLVGAALTRRPDLCAAAHAAVPLMDMIRYPGFEIARLWIPEYGDPATAEEFAWLWAYSPYHRIVDGTCYPATLVSAGAGDSRVDPMHARKMVARLQQATTCGDDHPILLRQEDRAGHGQGKPVSKQADELADVLTFFDLHLT
jgi:prolyl oligopeptidase